MEKIKQHISKVKTFIDAYKVWVFIVALFGTNGMHALYNNYSKPEESIIEEHTTEEVTKTDKETTVYNCPEVNPKITVRPIIKVPTHKHECTSSESIVTKHEEEHHGRER